jgi:hypothetical protein
MSAINGLSPNLGVLAEIRLPIMTARHGGRAYYHEAKYMPPKELTPIPRRPKTRLV